MYTVAIKKISKLHLNIVVALVVYDILIDEARIIFYLVSPQLYYAYTKQNLQAYLYWLNLHALLRNHSGNGIGLPL